MSTLTKQARETIKWWWFGDTPAERTTIAGYVRYQGYASVREWGGDRCGCPDDRCIGYHHDDETDCTCLPVWLDEYVDGIKHGETESTQSMARKYAQRAGGAA